jgi:hypothetical protein
MMSGTINHYAAISDLPNKDNEFFFTLMADDRGITELKFRKNAAPLFSTLLVALEHINRSFDKPYPTVGDFLRNLADLADTLE